MGELCKTFLIQFDCTQERAVHYVLIVGFVKEIPHPLTDAQGLLIENLRGKISGVPRKVYVRKDACDGYGAEKQHREDCRYCQAERDMNFCKLL